MCGIFAYVGKKQNAGELILEGLKSLEYRGYDSWGVAVKKNDGQVLIEKKVGKIGDSQFPQAEASIGLGHTRWATHGGVTVQNAHPHFDKERKVVVVHNGIIENFEEIKKKLIQKGYQFESQTDTEVLVHLAVEFKKTEPDLKKVVLSVFKRLAGLNAIIYFFPETEQILAIKKGSPLVFGDNGEEYLIASDSTAIVSYTKNVHYLDDNELLAIKRGGFEFYNLEGERKKVEFSTLQFEAEQVTTGDFPDFMSKEIAEQPRVLRAIAANSSEIAATAKLIDEAFGTYFIGCGTASYACLAGVYLFSKIAKKHVNFSVGSEFEYTEDFLTDKSLLIAVSQSGETIDVIEPVKKAAKKGAKIVALTNTLGSTLYRMADYKLLLRAGPEKAVCGTKSFTSMVAQIALLAYQITGKLEEGEKMILGSAAEIDSVLERQAEIKALANKISGKLHIYILGRGFSYPIAIESALKIKEVSYIHAEGFAGGELKHGVMALIEEGTPVIVFAPNDETKSAVLANAMEVKARGAFVIGVSDQKNDVFDFFFKVKDVGASSILPAVVFSQLLGYFLTKKLGYDVDKPRNLAKSVTVK